MGIHFALYVLDVHRRIVFRRGCPAIDDLADGIPSLLVDIPLEKLEHRTASIGQVAKVAEGFSLFGNLSEPPCVGGSDVTGVVAFYLTHFLDSRGVYH